MKESLIQEHLIQSGLAAEPSRALALLISEMNETTATKHDLALLAASADAAKESLVIRMDALRDSLESQMDALKDSLESQMDALKDSLESRIGSLESQMATKEMVERAIRVQTAWILSVVVFLVAVMGAMKLFA